MSIIRSKERTVQSPCVNVCELDRTDVCKACCRSKEEIAAWSQLDNQSKKQVIQNAYERALQRTPYRP